MALIPSSKSGIRPGAFALTLAASLVWGAALPAALGQTTNEEGRAAFAAGRYEDIIAVPIRDKRRDGEWIVLNLRALCALGRYEEARTIAKSVIPLFPHDAAVELEAHRVLKQTGDVEQAANALAVAAAPPTGIESIASVVARGEAQYLSGADAKTLLSDLLQPLQKNYPADRASYLAIARLGLAKHDYKLAADNYKEGLKRFPDDGEMTVGLARSLGTPKLALPLLETALQKNPRDAQALILQADMLWQTGQVPQAVESLQKALAVNPSDLEALSRLSAMALMDGDSDKAEKLRAQALATWKGNPRVDYLIGSALVGRYRFEEGIRALRNAASLDPSDLETRFELGSNLLRYGSDDEGWREIEAVHNRDPYNVAAFNLITLRDQLSKYEFVERGGVRLRMHPTDLKVYGSQALDFAIRAKAALTQKYGVPASTPLTVEVFGQQQDFAARTFAMPVGEGFLGVCFGPLVTTVSPRGIVQKMNWQDVLWHEIVHTVTLALSKHRVPRWLTEGISVYEEKLANPTWGRFMSGRYRNLIEKAEPPLTISALDSLFSSNIELAYFESGLAVEFMVEKYGFPALRQVLVDLGNDVPLDQALTRRMAPMDSLNAAFQEYALRQAKNYGPTIEWQNLTDAEYDAFAKDPDAWLAAHPRRYDAVVQRAHQLADEGRWDRVVTLLDGIIALEPNNHEEDNPYTLLAMAHRQLGHVDAERQALEKLITLEADSEPSLLRLIEIARQQNDTALTTRSAEAIMAIDPFQPAAQRALARALVADHQYREAASLLRAMLTLDPADSASLRLDLARALQSAGDSSYRRVLMDLLAEYPRNRAALLLLAKSAQ